MKKNQFFFSLVIFILLSNCSFAQIKSGIYGFGLTLAYDSSLLNITGCYENATGYDELTKSPRFTCIFYIKGIVKSNSVDIITYYPEDNLSDTISGKLEIINDHTVSIILREDHGGCWNVEQFSNDKVVFNLSQQLKLIQVKYVKSNKAYFYSDKTPSSKQKKYVVKNDFVYVEKVEGDWAYCSFYGNKITSGWINLVNLN